MLAKKRKVLVLYSTSEFPARKTVWSFLFSFRRFSDDMVYYHNLAFTPLPFFLKSIDYDMVIFSHFMTIPWNRTRYERKIQTLKNLGLKAKVRVAFFQDEYFNTDLTNKLISELNVQHVYSVAPKTEWKKLYPDVGPSVEMHEYLTGYIDPQDIRYCLKKYDSVNKTIDVGYRTGWPSGEIFRLGYWGVLKYKIAELFLSKPSSLKLDIGVGSGFITGSKWLDFLLSCKYTIGVESGASLLDRDGSIYPTIQKYIQAHPQATYEEVSQKCYPGLDGNLDLKAISPRIFESALAKACMVLVEGSYNGILIPHKHYIPLRADFSNIDEVFQTLKEDKVRAEIVENVCRDLIQNGKFLYSDFVNSLHQTVRVEKAAVSLTDEICYLMSYGTDFISWCMSAIWSQVVVKLRKKLSF